MPEYEVAITYTVEYTGTVIVKAASEEKAEEIIDEDMQEKVQNLDQFKAYVEQDWEITKEDFQVDEVNEV